MAYTEGVNFKKSLSDLLGLEGGASIGACLQRIRQLLDRYTARPLPHVALYCLVAHLDWQSCLCVCLCVCVWVYVCLPGAHLAADAPSSLVRATLHCLDAVAMCAAHHGNCSRTLRAWKTKTHLLAGCRMHAGPVTGVHHESAGMVKLWICKMTTCLTTMGRTRRICNNRRRMARTTGLKWRLEWPANSPVRLPLTSTKVNSAAQAILSSLCLSCWFPKSCMLLLRPFALRKTLSMYSKFVSTLLLLFIVMQRSGVLRHLAYMHISSNPRAMFVRAAPHQLQVVGQEALMAAMFAGSASLFQGSEQHVCSCCQLC